MSRVIPYRPDIDGLRAIAVISVILSHLGVPSFFGGYLGVDIFFVISGYLMGRILFEEMQETGALSLAKFYARRVRRILPALMSVLLVSALLAYLLLRPADLLHFTRSIPSSIFFYANQHFMKNAQDYFLAQQTTTPLLHTWSLAIEEQFYLLLPLLLLISAHRGRPSIRLLIIILLASLMFATITSVLLTQESFFGLSSRLWELLVGVVAAAGVSRPFPGYKTRTASIVSLCCLATIIFYIILLHPLTFILYKSTETVAICIFPLCFATALFIHIGNSHVTFAHRLISNRIFTGTGLISYSLYLIHWPLLQYMDYLTPHERDGYLTLIYLCLCFILAILNWHYVEKPCRRLSFPLKKLIWLLLALAAILLLFSVAAEKTDGFSRRIPTGLSRMETDEKIISRIGECFMDDKKLFDKYYGGCVSSKPGAINILLLGDSHAAHFYRGLAKYYEGSNVRISQFTGQSCAPLRDVKKAYCNQVRPIMLSEVESDRFDIVIVSADWIERAEISEDEMFRRLDETLAQLAPHTRILLVGPGAAFAQIPANIDTPQTPAYDALRKWIVGSRKTTIDTRPEIALMDAAMRTRYGARYHYLSLADEFCPHRQCTYRTKQGGFLVWDDEHLTVSGSEEVVARAIGPALDRLISKVKK